MWYHTVEDGGQLNVENQKLTRRCHKARQHTDTATAVALTECCVMGQKTY